MRNQKKIIELLKSGNFSLYYHDSDNCTLHNGHISYEETDLEEYPENKEVATLGDLTDGYLPDIVILMAKALGGKVGSV